MITRVRVDTPATLAVTFYDSEGEVAIDPGVTTVTITRSDGTAVVTAAATTGTGAAARTYPLAAQVRPDHLTVVWTGSVGGRRVTSEVEVVGAFYAELAEIRALDALSNTANYPTAKLARARHQAEDVFEDVTGVAWVPRHARELLDGTNEVRLRLAHQQPRSLIAVSVAGVVQADLTAFRLYPYAAIERVAGATWPSEVSGGGQNIVVEYLHGFDAPPADLREAFLVYVRDRLLMGNSRIPDRASLMSTDFGTFNLVTAGGQRYTGLPDVDAVLQRYRQYVALAVA